MSNSFFYCYDKELMKFLRYDKGIQYICTGLNITSKDQFWQFDKKDGIYEAFQEFMLKKSNKNRQSDCVEVSGTVSHFALVLPDHRQSFCVGFTPLRQSEK